MPNNPRIAISRQSTQQSIELTDGDLRAVLDRFLAELGFSDRGLSLLLADNRTLRELNLAHRGRDEPTDVLSWRYTEAEGHAGATPEAPLLGDLAISLERAREQAHRNGWNLRTEVLRLLAHGCAHLAGYDHNTAAAEREMLGREEALLKAVGIEHVYPARENQPGGPSSGA